MKNIILLALLFVMFMGVVYGAIVATGGEHSDMTGKIVGVSGCRLITPQILIQYLYREY